MNDAAPSPEAMILELARRPGLTAAWIPASVRQICPGVHETVRRLMSVTLGPTGREDLVCLVAGAPDAETTATIELALAATPEPFLLLLPAPDAPGGAVTMADDLIRRRPQLLARGPRLEHGAVLVASLSRLLSVDAAPGQWSGASAPASALPAAEPALATLWRAAEEDRRSLEALTARIEAAVRERGEARRALERATAEIARVTAIERHEVQRLALMLADDRAWVAEQSRRIAASASWRIGHRLMRLGRRLVRRPDRGTNLPAMIARRMDEADLR